MIANFWDVVNEEVYREGGKTLFEQINESYPSISDEDYEKMYEDLTEQAREGDLRNLTKEQAYFLLADVYDFENANVYLSAV